MISFACVWVGNKYPIEYVVKLRNMIALNLPIGTKFEIVCLTDHTEAKVQGVRFFYVDAFRISGWWAKMALFSGITYTGKRVIYFDLDTIITGDLSPLLRYDETEFAICENFTKRAGHPTWPCNYGSCVMTFDPAFGLNEIWRPFRKNQNSFISTCRRGDQEAIEKLYPSATYLQDVMPDGFFMGYRDFPKEVKPPGLSVAIFAGNHNPHNTQIKWLKDAWQ